MKDLKKQKSGEYFGLMESVEYGNQIINFYIQRAKRKTLGIEVHPDQSVWAKAPIDANLKDVKSKILKRAQWIVKQKQFFEQFLPRTPERQYMSGETHLYLGKRYILRLKKGEANTVKLKGGELIVFYTSKPTGVNVKQLLTAWYYHHAQVRLKKQFEVTLALFRNKINATPTLELRRMKNRWGSCTPSGKIIINPELIKAPTKCIQYVLTHEFCHLLEPNHNKSFYDLQDAMFPENKKWKHRLEVFMV